MLVCVAGRKWLLVVVSGTSEVVMVVWDSQGLASVVPGVLADEVCYRVSSNPTQWDPPIHPPTSFTKRPLAQNKKYRIISKYPLEEVGHNWFDNNISDSCHG